MTISHTAQAAIVRPLLLTDKAVAHALGCGRTTVWNLMAAGELDYVKQGKSRRILASSLEAYVSRLAVRRGRAAA
jgi:excisionase family DNA binding protein